MRGIGGNIQGTLQTFVESTNAIGEAVREWVDAAELFGWLDLMSQTKSNTALSDFLANSTHVFICDYTELPEGITNDNTQMVIGGEVYHVELIDNPMGLDYQLEIYLRKSGWQS